MMVLMNNSYNLRLMHRGDKIMKHANRSSSYYKSRYYHVYKRYGCLMSNNEITNRIIYLLSNKYLIGGNHVGIKNFLTLNINYNRT